MFSRLAKHYTRRLINVNVNILVAGILALLPTVAIVHLTTEWGWTLGWATRLGLREATVINAVTFVSDLIFDVAILFSLHWLANHWPRKWRKAGEAPDQPHLPYWKDATLLQMERMVVSPVMYALFLGTQHLLIESGINAAIATVVGYVVGGSVTRTMHTMWMLRCERRQKARWAAQKAVVGGGTAVAVTAAGAAPTTGSAAVPPRV